MRWFKLPISRLCDFTRSYDKTSYRILKRGPGFFGTQSLNQSNKRPSSRPQAMLAAVRYKRSGENWIRHLKAAEKVHGFNSPGGRTQQSTGQCNGEEAEVPKILEEIWYKEEYQNAERLAKHAVCFLSDKLPGRARSPQIPFQSNGKLDAQTL